MFRSRHRRSPFADFIDWNDYRFHGPMRTAARHGWNRRRHPILRALVVLAIVWVIVRLVRGRRFSGWT